MVALAALGLATAGCSAPASRAVRHPSTLPTPRFVRVQVTDAGRTAIRRVPLEEYVQAAILSEFAPPAGDVLAIERMLEVQAVVSRTYAVAHLARHDREGFDLCATTHCQLYQPARLRSSRWTAAAAAAVRRTSAEVLWYDGAPVSALFHADCGGQTSSAAEVWGGAPRPYLVGVADDGPAETAHTEWRYEATAAAVLKALNADPRTRAGSRLTRLEIVERDSAGRAGRIAVRGLETRIVRGEAFREVLARAFGDRTIKSTRFDVRRNGNTFVFEGRGFGHGVGLCQAGAFARIKAGAKALAVLSRYYPGAKLIALRP
jgi:stage II sporulation protein D (peptidoglycan lytic transglycosylase)